MCYWMMDKRSDAAKKSIDTPAKVETRKAEPATAGAESAGKAFEGLMGRLQKAPRKDEIKEKESA